MFASKAAKSKLLAFGVVAMFVLCAVSCVADSDAAGPYGEPTNSGTTKDQVYSVDISTNQQFEYAVNTSLAGYGNFAWSNELPSGFTFTESTDTKGSGTLSGKFTSVPTDGKATAKLSVTWTPDATTDGDNSNISQTATQTINFNVVQDIEIAQNITLNTLVGKTSTDAFTAISYTGGTTDSNTVMLLKLKDGDGDAAEATTLAGVPFTFTHNVTGRTITVAPTGTLSDSDKTSGPYTVEATIKNKLSGDMDTIEITINVFDTITIDNTTTHYYAYEGQTDGIVSSGFYFIVNYDNDDGEDTTFTHKIVFDPEGTVLTELDKGTSDSKTVIPIKVDVSTGFDKDIPGSLINNSQNFRNYTAELTVTGSAGPSGSGAATSEDSCTATLTVYKSLAFMSKPTTSDIKATGVSAGSNSITLSSYISGAKSVKFDWNDGTTTESIVTKTAANYAVNHTYAKAGTYLITITATNDMGTTTSKVMYSVGNDTTTPSDKTTTDTDDKKDTGFFEKHGYLFIVFLLLAGLLAFVAFYLGYQIPPVLIAIPVCVVLAVLLFFYKDFGGIIDAIKGLF